MLVLAGREQFQIATEAKIGPQADQAPVHLGQDGQWHKADLYRVSKPAGPYAPSKGYVEDMIEGAREHGLTPDYIERLVALRRSLD